MNGIVFMHTKQLAPLTDFYTKRLDCNLWLEQPECKIFRHGTFLFGFCRKPAPRTDPMLTFVYDSPASVDRMYDRLADIAEAKPKNNRTYNIYQFFAKDPEGRPLEFQHFTKPTAEILTGDSLLLSRRSIRSYRRKKVPEEIVRQIIDICRFAPSARNNQSFYFKMITDPDTLDMLAISRVGSSDPIGSAPMAVAICGDTAESKYCVQDATIAATYFLLAARQLGLGTCWIGNMDTPSIKKLIGIPRDHCIATISPLGYPAGKLPDPPERKPVDEFIR